MSTAQKRNYALDNIRAIAIIVVVLGHSIILYSSDWGAYNSAVYYPFLDYLKKFINLFQMPLFFSLSGYLFIQQYQKKSYLHLISNKSIRLLVPYISVALLWMIPIKLIVSYPGYDGKNFADIFLKGILLCQDNGHLWYLPCLFIIFLISKLLFSLRTKLISHNTKLKAKSEWIDILFLLIPVAFLFLSFKMPVPLFKNVLKYYIWFYWGGILFAYREQIKKLKTKFVMAFLILLLILQPMMLMIKPWIPKKRSKSDALSPRPSRPSRPTRFRRPSPRSCGRQCSE